MLHPHLSFRSRSSTVGLGLSIAGAVFLTGCASAPKEAPPPQVACPAGVPAGVQCWRGQDSAGSHYLLAKPAPWSGVLVVHAHGGPALGEPKASRADEDIQRWAGAFQRNASNPFLSSRLSNLSDGPLGFLSPNSHF